MSDDVNVAALQRLRTALADRYRIEEELGAGGMAVVFSAEDLKHKRRVAVKVLRSELAAILGGERFLKEIEVTANLQHPNILPLYDSGEADGFLYYVMPLVEGETLREKLDREEQLPVDEAVAIAKAVAAALDYAHRHDVIHRDIKPSNILLHEGQALVSDFGIALAMRNAGSHTRLTETGLSIGTPHYMSPEQAAGDRALGAQSDLYSLGAVLYEMLVGEPPHVAKSVQAVVAKILQDTPAPIRRSRELVPTNVEAAVAKSIARSPADRFQSAAELSDALSNPAFVIPSLLPQGAAGPPSRWTTLGPAAAALAAVMAGLAAWGWMRPGPAPTVARWELPLPAGEELRRARGATDYYDVAPNGSWLVYANDRDGPLMIRHRDRLEPVPLPGTDSAFAPRVSPDGSRIAYLHAGEGHPKLRVTAAGGGPIVTLADSAFLSEWLDEETLVYARTDDESLRRIASGGGESELVWSGEESGMDGIRAIAPLPDQRGVLLIGCADCTTRQFDAYAVDFATGETRLLFPASHAQYTSLGHVVFVRADGTVLAAPFDSKALELTGDAVPLMEGVAGFVGRMGFQLAENGTLLVGLGSVPEATPGSTANRELVAITRSGEVSVVDEGWRFAQSGTFGGFSLSPDGTKLAIALLSTSDAGPQNEDIWVKELPDGPLSRLTQDPLVDARPAWMPDGQRVVFLTAQPDQSQGRLRSRRADGAGEVTDFLTYDRLPGSVDISPDGQWAVARVGGQANETGIRDIVAFRIGADTATVPLLQGSYDEAQPKLSPDGRWLAYNSNESGRYEVYVRPFPEVESAKVQVSVDGGMDPMWNGAGDELVYFEPVPDEFFHRAVSARVDAGQAFRVVSREKLFVTDGLIRPQGLADNFQMTPDGQTFYARRFVQSTSSGSTDSGDGADAPETFRLVLIENWLEEVRETLGLRR